MDSRIPVSIITGFLGSGKTTLLNSLIKEYPQKKFAIIENEFGEIGIDSGLIIGANEKIFELSNGCICCSLNNDFSDTIDKLLNGDYVFNHLLVETTGIADPISIVKSFVDDENIQLQFKIDSVICLIDAANFEELYEEQIEIRQQISLSDILLMNKTDLVNADYLDELKEKLHSLNPVARIESIKNAAIHNKNILDTYAYSGKELEKSVREFKGLSMDNSVLGYQNNSLISKPKIQFKHEIVSEGFVIPGFLDMELFSFWIRNYLYFNRNNIFRAKGILAFHDMPEKYIFHSVRGSFLFEEGSAWENEQAFSKLVFIGKKISRNDLQQNLEQLIYKKDD